MNIDPDGVPRQKEEVRRSIPQQKLELVYEIVEILWCFVSAVENLNFIVVAVQPYTTRNYIFKSIVIFE